MKNNFINRAFAVVVLSACMSFFGCSTENLVQDSIIGDISSNDYLNQFISEVGSVIEETISSGYPISIEEIDKVLDSRGYHSKTRSAGYGDIDYAYAVDMFTEQYSEELYAFIEDKFLSDSFLLSEIDNILEDARLSFSPSHYEVIKLFANGIELYNDVVMQFGGATRASQLSCDIAFTIIGGGGAWLIGAAIGGPVGALIGWGIGSAYQLYMSRTHCATL